MLTDFWNFALSLKPYVIWMWPGPALAAITTAWDFVRVKLVPYAGRGWPSVTTKMPWITKPIPADTKWSLSIIVFLLGVIIACFLSYRHEVATLRTTNGLSYTIYVQRHVVHVKGGATYTVEPNNDVLVFVDYAEETTTTILLPPTPVDGQSITVKAKGPLNGNGQETIIVEGNGHIVDGRHEFSMPFSLQGNTFTFDGSDWGVL